MIGKFKADPDHRVAVLTGFAGTGKTTLLRQIADAYGYPVVLAPTGKAALRVGEATGLGACTIHRYLYKAETDPRTGAPIWTVKEAWEMADENGKLVIIDEASMIDKGVWIDLNAVAKRAGFKILLVGDTAQLPPVSKGKDEEDFNSLNTETPYRAHLTEIHRQALESPIIRASMILRSKRPAFEAMSLLTPIGASKLIETIVDQRDRGGFVLCHTNRRRHWLNNQMRQALGHPEGSLEEGEPLLVMQNNYAIDRYNGEILNFKKWTTQPNLRQIVSDRYTTSSMELYYGVGLIEGDARVMVSPDEVSGRTEGSKVGNWAIRKFAKYAYDAIAAGSSDEAPPYLHTNYGYALTVHKSQGSQAPEVLLVLDGSMDRMAPAERAKLLYTAVTRAQNVVRYVYLDDLPRE